MLNGLHEGVVVLQVDCGKILFANKAAQLIINTNQMVNDSGSFDLNERVFAKIDPSLVNIDDRLNASDVFCMIA